MTKKDEASTYFHSIEQLLYCHRSKGRCVSFMGVDREASLVLQMPQSKIHLKQLLYGAWKEGIPYAKCMHVFSWVVFQCWMLHRTWLLVSHPTNPWSRRGCRLCLTQGVDDLQKREQPAQHWWRSDSTRKGLQEVRGSQPVCHTVWMEPPNVAPSQMALPQKGDLDPATWMLLAYFSTCRTWNTQ